MSTVTPSMAAGMAAAVALQLAGGLLLPATRGFTAPLPTIGCILGITIGGFLLSRLIVAGAPLSLLIPVSTVMAQIAALIFGVLVYHEPASNMRITLLVISSVLVGIAGFL